MNDPGYIDLSGDCSKDVVVAAGTPETYQGHPTTLLLPGTETVLCVWTLGHGGFAGPAALSGDGGLSWTRIDSRFPACYRRFANCPSIYRIRDPRDGKYRIFVYAMARIPEGQPRSCFSPEGMMPSVVSEDGGQTWRDNPPLGPDFACVMTFSSMLELADGSTMGFYHRRADGMCGEAKGSPLVCMAASSGDGGFSWSKPSAVAAAEGLDLCEPCAIRSPDGGEICVLMRENARKAQSQFVVSRDEGLTWSKPAPLSWALTGDRHAAAVLPDGRFAICMRNMDLRGDRAENGDLFLWVGSYGEIVGGQPGTRYRLLKSHAGYDASYPGVSVLPDGTLLVVTYIKYRDDECRNSVVACRVKV